MALVVQQFAWKAEPLALPHFAGSLYVLLVQAVSIPQHFVVSASQHVPP